MIKKQINEKIGFTVLAIGLCFCFIFNTITGPKSSKIDASQLKKDDYLLVYEKNSNDQLKDVLLVINNFTKAKLLEIKNIHDNSFAKISYEQMSSMLETYKIKKNENISLSLFLKSFK